MLYIILFPLRINFIEAVTQGEYKRDKEREERERKSQGEREKERLRDRPTDGHRVRVKEIGGEGGGIQTERHRQKGMKGYILFFTSLLILLCCLLS